MIEIEIKKLWLVTPTEKYLSVLEVEDVTGERWTMASRVEDGIVDHESWVFFEKTNETAFTKQPT